MSENSPKEFDTNIFMYFDMRGHLDGLFHWRKHYYILYLFFLMDFMEYLFYFHFTSY